MPFWVLKRIVLIAFSLWGLSILIFIVARVLPGDPAKMALGERASEWALNQYREQLHLNQPLYIQYLYWLRDAFTLNFGTSLMTNRPVLYDISMYFPATLELVIWSTIISSVLAIVLGVVAGMRANTWVDNVFRLVSYIGVSVPNFVTAVLSIFVFSLMLGVFPVGGRLSSGVQPPPSITGMYTFDALITGRLATFLDAVRHIILPVASSVLIAFCNTLRVVRSSVVENLGKDYVSFERAHGISERDITLKYLLKPSIIPAVALIGMNVGISLSALFIIESVFMWPGFAMYGMEAFLRKDLNAIVGVVMITGLVYAISNVAVDVVVNWLDPRIRITQRSK